MNPIAVYKRLIFVSWALLAAGGLGFFHGLAGYLLAREAGAVAEVSAVAGEVGVNAIWLVVFACGVVLNVGVESYLGRRVWMELAGGGTDENV